MKWGRTSLWWNIFAFHTCHSDQKLHLAADVVTPISHHRVKLGDVTTLCHCTTEMVMDLWEVCHSAGSRSLTTE